MLPTDCSDWIGHPTDKTVDVALTHATVPSDSDHLYFPLESIATDDVLRQHHVGPGDEVFVTGLFSNHHGTGKNIPIIRVGNIAAMPEERVKSKFGDIEAYLIEARSTGGLSGSPVFLSPGNQTKDGAFVVGPRPIYLLGLTHGHFDVKVQEDSILDVDEGTRSVNVGIGVVVPATKIFEILDQHPHLVERRRVEVERWRQRKTAQAHATTRSL